MNTQIFQTLQTEKYFQLLAMQALLGNRGKTAHSTSEAVPGTEASTNFPFQQGLFPTNLLLQNLSQLLNPPLPSQNLHTRGMTPNFEGQQTVTTPLGANKEKEGAGFVPKLQPSSISNIEHENRVEKDKKRPVVRGFKVPEKQANSDVIKESFDENIKPIPDGIKSKKIKKKRMTCGHTDRKHYAKGLCSSCYHKKTREKKPLLCPHDKLYAKDLCQRCYTAKYKKTENPDTIFKDETPEVQNIQEEN